MNWKVGFLAAALLITLMPTGAFSRNHQILNGLSPSSGLTNGASALGGATSILGNHSSLTGGLTHGLTNGITSAASPVASTLTSGLTNHGIFNSNSLFSSNKGLLNNNNGNGLFHRKHKGNLLTRILSVLLPGRFSNGRFNNNGSIFGNTSPGNGFRSMLGRNN